MKLNCDSISFMTNLTPLPCIVCDKVLEPSMNSANGYDYQTPPSGATVFTSVGNYGSSFDPMSGNVFLEVNICNQCLSEKAKKSAVLRGKRPSQPAPSFEFWDETKHQDY